VIPGNAQYWKLDWTLNSEAVGCIKLAELNLETEVLIDEAICDRRNLDFVGDCNGYCLTPTRAERR
jgi:hypothetical protein